MKEYITNVLAGRCATFTLLYVHALLRRDTRLGFMHTNHMLEAVPAALSMDVAVSGAISSRWVALSATVPHVACMVSA